VTTLRMNRVDRSRVSAITHTSASGPFAPRTTPPISSSSLSISIVAGAAATRRAGRANSAAKLVAAAVLR
jgi:hypothetical protein